MSVTVDSVLRSEARSAREQAVVSLRELASDVERMAEAIGRGDPAASMMGRLLGSTRDAVADLARAIASDAAVRGAEIQRTDGVETAP